MRNAYLVLGPEASGTRFITRLLIDAGCFGDDGHSQRLDTAGDWDQIKESELPNTEIPIVWHRSFPHAQHYVNIQKPIEQLRANAYAVHAIITARDWFPMVESQAKSGLAANSLRGLEQLRRAYRQIFGFLPEDVPFVMVSYESFGRYQRKAVRKMLEMLGLPMPESMTAIKDGNRKMVQPLSIKAAQFFEIIELGFVEDTTKPDSILHMNFRNSLGRKSLRQVADSHRPL